MKRWLLAAVAAAFLFVGVSTVVSTPSHVIVFDPATGQWVVGQGPEFPTLSFTPPLNARFYRTDTGVEYKWSGTGWMALQGEGIGTIDGSLDVTGAVDIDADVDVDSDLSVSSEGVVSANGVPLNSPSTYVSLAEDFSTGGGTSGVIGRLGLLFNAINTGTYSAAGTYLTGGGILLSHVSNDNSGGVLGLGNSSTWKVVSNDTIWTSTNWSLDYYVTPGAEGTAITNVSMFVGLSNTNTAYPITSGAGLIGVRYDTDLSDATYVFVTCDSATTGCAEAGDATNQKVAASTITPVAGTRNRIRIRHQLSGVGGNPTWYFRVNDETEVTFCSSGCTDVATEVPAGTVALGPVFAYITQTTTGVLQGSIDLWELNAGPIPARY